MALKEIEMLLAASRPTGTGEQFHTPRNLILALLREASDLGEMLRLGPITRRTIKKLRNKVADVFS